MRALSRRRVLRRRDRETPAALLVAAAEDPRFDVDGIDEVVAAMLRRAAGIVHLPEGRLGREVLRQVEEAFGPEARRQVARLARRSTAAATVGEFTHHLVGVENRGREADAEVVVCVRGLTRLPIEDVPLLAWWTLRAGAVGVWRRVLVEVGARGAWQLGRGLRPEAMAARGLADAAVLELAHEAPTVTGVPPSGSGPSDVRHLLLDRALVDPRWSPEVIEAEVREFFAAWQGAVAERTTDDLQRLRRESIDEVLGALLRPDLRVGELEHVAPAGLGEAMAGTVRVALSVQGWAAATDDRGWETRAPLRLPRPRTILWELTLDPRPDRSWRLTRIIGPAAGRTV